MVLPQTGAVRAAALMWRRGVWEALQLQRCVVYFVLDSSGKVLAQTTKCIVANGLVYLGSLLVFSHCTQPAMDWLLATYAEPAYGPAGVAAWRQLLVAVFQLLWLLPVYGVTLMVSCIWYQQIAVTAFEVQHQQQLQKQQAAAAAAGEAPATQQQQQQQQQQPSHEAAAGSSAAPPAVAGHRDWHGMQQPPGATAALQGPPVSSAGTTAAAAPVAGGGGMMQVLEGTAQEVFRLLLFVVFTIEVFFMSLVPCGIGMVLNVLFLSWLYAFYCFDYKWSLQGIRLPQRLQFFEANWAFFAGFGFPCVAATMVWPFHVGAALTNLLFPVFIMVACGADPLQARADVLGAADNDAPAGSLPIFKVALRPTYWLIQRVFGPRSSTSTHSKTGAGKQS